MHGAGIAPSINSTPKTACSPTALIGYSTNLSQMGEKMRIQRINQQGCLGSLWRGECLMHKQGNESRNAQVSWTWEGAEMVCVRRRRCEHD